MMGFYFITLYFPIIIFIWSQSHVKAAFLIHKSEYMDNKKCVMRLAVEGHGVDDALYTSCEDGRKLDIHVEDSQLAIGDRNDPLRRWFLDKCSLAADETGKRDQKSDSWKQTAIKGIRGIVSKAKEVPNVCKQTSSNQASTCTYMSPNVMVMKSEKLSDLKDSCTGRIQVMGDGINYDENIACPQVQDRRVVFSPEGVILHDYRGAIQSVIVSQESVVTVNQDGSCNRMTSTNKDSQRETNILMDVNSCSRAKEILNQYLGVRIYRHSYWKKYYQWQDIVIRGFGIDYVFKIPNYFQARNMRIQYSAKCGVLLVGDYRSNDLSAFSDTPGTLVVIETKEKVCTKHTFEGGTNSSAILDEKDCLKIKDRVDEALKVITEDEEEGSFYEFHVSKTEPSFRKNKKNQEGDVLFQDVLVRGKGIDYEFTDNLYNVNRLELHTTPSGLILCEYEDQWFCLVAEVRTTTIIKAVSCSKISYDGGDRKYNERIIDKKTCDAAKEKMAYYRNRNV